MLGLWEKPKEEIDIKHFAFERESVEYLKIKINCSSFLKDGNERPMILTWMPAISLYFDNPDRHSLEIIGILDGKSKTENGIISYEKWKELEQN